MAVSQQPKIHDFASSNEVGEMGEQDLKESLAPREGWKVTKLPNRRGDDRDFKREKPDGSTDVISVKTDQRVSGFGEKEKTGNFFMELWSNYEAGEKGWATESQADRFLFYDPERREWLEIPAREIRRLCLGPWRKRYYFTDRVQNDGYRSAGLCIPRSQVISAAKKYGAVYLPQLELF